MVRQSLIALLPGCQRLRTVSASLAAVLLIACAADTPLPTPAAGSADAMPMAQLVAPELPREFRGAWVATVANIDWPSKKGLSPAAQQAEITAIVARAKAIGLNALVLQVRPSADAIYPSELEPWTEFLSGEQGKAPGAPGVSATGSEQTYDPLQVWVSTAHKAGIELHAWFNPYRARHPTAKSALAANHIARTDPGAVKTYGAHLWLDPGEPVAVQRTVDVVTDVVRRYDIDGVHFDDYFYPYPESVVQKASTPAGATLSVKVDFPDDNAWAAYRAGSGALSRADWRRENVNTLVQRVQAQVLRQKPWVRFGISPFGLGKPATRPSGISGFSQYDELYADVELWLQNGWIDYLVPQLYWPIDQKAQAFVPLLDYWSSQNTAKRAVWAGLYTSRIDASSKSWAPTEITQQIEQVRERARTSPSLQGHVHFSMIALMQNRQGIADQLSTLYAAAALPPATTQDPSCSAVVTPPKLHISATGVVQINSQASCSARQFAVWSRSDGAWSLDLLVATENSAGFKPGAAVDALVVSAIDRGANEGPRTSQLLRATRPTP